MITAPGQTGPDPSTALGTPRPAADDADGFPPSAGPSFPSVQGKRYPLFLATAAAAHLERPAARTPGPRTGAGLLGVPAGEAPCSGPEEDVGGAAPRAWRRTVGLGVFVVVFNLCVVGLEDDVARSGYLTRDSAETLGLLVGLGFYAFMARLAFKARDETRVRPTWSVGGSRRALLTGAAVGAAVAVVVLLLQQVTTGHASGDALINLVVDQGNLARSVLTVVMAVVAAPVVEELVFRGLILQSLRDRGRNVGLFVSALLFSLAHLRLQAVWYYVVLGLILGSVYLRRGLRSSMAAHAAFNGTLVLAALYPMFTSTGYASVGGAQFAVPAGWHTLAPASDADRTLLIGPAGADLAATWAPLPPGETWSAARAMADVGAGVPIGLGHAVVDSAHPEVLPAGTGLMMRITIAGHAGYLFEIGDGTRLFTLAADSGSDPAIGATLQSLLTTLQLPPAPAG